MTERVVTVVNELGLHARAAARFVHVASRFEAQIRVGRDARMMDGKSILGILLLAAARGTAIRIAAQGIDEREAVDALAQLVESGFGEHGQDGSPAPAADQAPASRGHGDKWNGSRE